MNSTVKKKGFRSEPSGDGLFMVKIKGEECEGEKKVRKRGNNCPKT